MRSVLIVASGALVLALLSVRAVAQPPCPGDCDGNGATSADDFALALRAVFAAAPVDCAAADLDGSGTVTAAELLRIRSAIIQPPPSCTGAPTPTATPVPGTPRSMWIPLTPLPGGARQEVGVAALAGRIYVIGGFTETTAGSAAVEVYDSATNLWQRVADLPAQRNHVGAAALANQLYVAGGFVGSGFTPAADVYRYEPSADQWTPVASLPAARGALALAELGGKLYASGGSGAAGSVAAHAVYDPATDAWTDLMPLPSPRNHLAAVALDSALYVIGGRSDGSGDANTGELDRYDPAVNGWTVLAPMPTARSGHAAAVVSGRIVVMGGEVNFDNPPTYVFPQVELYDPAANTWTALDPMPVPRHGIGAATVGELIYVPGGAQHGGFDATDHSDALRLLF
jgi:N-acetylneuraminic acid mutarotase